jgi:hypothetical protein
VQCRINPKSTEKRGKIRGQMKKLFEIEIVTHRMAAILKTDLYSKLERLEHWKLSLRCANANSISRRRKQKTENRKQIIGDLRHLTFQVSVIRSYISQDTAARVYQGLIEPYFSYCAPVLDGIGSKLSDKLQKLQN